MKQFILLLTLFILTSCGVSVGDYSNSSMDKSNYAIISKIETKSQGELSEYEVTYSKHNFNLFCYFDNYFIDSTGKFNIGDTITTCKYKH